MYDFFSIQRLSPRLTPRDGDTGLDRQFVMDYLGNSTFEWGALPAALKTIRAFPSLVFRGYPLTVDDVTRTVYLIGEESALDAQMDDLDLWAHAYRPFRTEELTYFPEVFAGHPREHVTAVAWWSIDDNVLFTLDAETADNILEALRPTL